MEYYLHVWHTSVSKGLWYRDEATFKLRFAARWFPTNEHKWHHQEGPKNIQKGSNYISFFFLAAWVGPGQSVQQSAKRRWKETLLPLYHDFLQSKQIKQAKAGDQTARGKERKKPKRKGKGRKVGQRVTSDTSDRRQKNDRPLGKTLTGGGISAEWEWICLCEPWDWRWPLN